MDFISTFSLLSGLCLHTSNGRVRTGLASLITIGSLVGGTGTATAQSAQVATGNASPATGGVTEIISREASGKVTLRATRVTRPIVLDGKLDDEIYQQVPAAGDFVQQEPVEGELATEKTDMWVFFDDRFVYITARCWETEPRLQVANEFRRDHSDIQDGDNLVVVLDTFYDRRNGVYFQVNPRGGLRDMQVSDERQANPDWNAVWDAKVTKDDKGWTVEMAVPLKSLRYKTSGQQTWGINARRMVRWKNETSYLSRVPASWGGRGILKFSSAATLVGVELPKITRNLEVKPFVTSGVFTNRVLQPSFTDDLRGDWGIDAKYGLTKGLNMDLTYNTDFAQVEADDSQVNFGRANIIFPEKRDFFLEGQGIFAFGGVSARPPGGDGAGNLQNENTAPNLSPIMFFSRAIGLQSGQPVPITVGARVTGRQGRYSVGLLNLQTDELAGAGARATNFSVVRVRRDLFRRGSIGGVATYRPQRSGSLTGANEVFGGDMTLAFFQNLNINTYFAKSVTPGSTTDQTSYLVKVDNTVDRWGANFERLKVGEGFNPEIGFLRRRAFARTFGQAQFSPRPKNAKLVRKYNYRTNIDWLQNPTGKLESGEWTGTFRADFQSGDQIEHEYARSYEYLADPFGISRAAGDRVQIAPGEYHFGEHRTTIYLAPQHPMTGRINVLYGTFYDGNRTELAFNGRVNINPRIDLSPRIQYDWLDLRAARFTTKLVAARIGLALTPRMALSSLFQYSSAGSSLVSNIRFRWEYIPGSDLFVVYTDNNDTRFTGISRLQNRAFIIKATRMVRF